MYITIEYKNPHHKLMKGIYKITFGRKFYIGQCRRLSVRVFQHQRGINGCMSRYGMPKSYEKVYLPWARYLFENPQIKFGTIEMLQRCVTAKELMIAEASYLQDLRTNPDCLNASFTVPMRYIDDGMWDCDVQDDWLIHYFDPREPAKRYSQYQKLTAAGEIWTRKPSKKDQEYIRQLLSPLPPAGTTP
jgi:hypothetical protein